MSAHADQEELRQADSAAGSDMQSDGSDFSDAADEVPDLEAALADQLFAQMFNYLLQACQHVQHGTNLVVTEDCAEALRLLVWEHLWLPRVGFAEDEVNPAKAARPLPLPTPQ